MSPKEFEAWLSGLDDEKYDALIQERIPRLSEEEQKIVQAREVRRQERRKLSYRLDDPDPKVRKEIMDAIIAGEGHECEHGRSWLKHCLACGKIDHIMFPELFDEDGFDIEEE